MLIQGHTCSKISSKFTTSCIFFADEFKNDRQMFAFLATEQRITYKLLIEKCKTKIQVYSGRNQNHRPGKFTFLILQLVHSHEKALTTHKFL